MKLSSVITPMTEGATPLMSPTMNPSRRRSVRKTSGRTASSTTKRLPSMKLSRFAELPWLKTVISKDRRFVELSMSVGPNRKNMMLKMMSSNVRLSRMRNAKMKHLDTPLLPSVLSGQGKFAM